MVATRFRDQLGLGYDDFVTLGLEHIINGQSCYGCPDKSFHFDSGFVVSFYRAKDFDEAIMNGLAGNITAFDW